MTTWREIANDLGARMANHAYCDTHPLAQADPDNCPFCDDRRAYLRWLKKKTELEGDD